jgi:hypothetical protein
VAGPHVRIVTNLPATPNASQPKTLTAQQTALRGLHEELLQQTHRHLLDHYEENATMLDITLTPDNPMEDIIMEEAIPPLPPIRPLWDPLLAVWDLLGYLMRGARDLGPNTSHGKGPKTH